MARKEPYWVKLFLRELSRTGNVRLSAERAGVDHTSAYQRRKRHGAFAEAWEASFGAFREGAGQAEVGHGDRHVGPSTIGSSANGPPPSAGIPPAQSRRRSLEASSAHPGEELIVRPDGKLIKGSEARWSEWAEERFLTELTVSGSVRFAARAAGFSTTAVYKQRLKNKRFAAAWEAAVETGKARVQSYLVEAATRTFDPDELPIGDEREIPKVSISEAINIAKMPGRSAPAASGEEAQYDEDHLKEVRERILDKLARLRQRDIDKGWTPWPLAEPLEPDGSITEVWVPPGYMLVRKTEEEGPGR